VAGVLARACLWEARVLTGIVHTFDLMMNVEVTGCRLVHQHVLWSGRRCAWLKQAKRASSVKFYHFDPKYQRHAR